MPNVSTTRAATEPDYLGALRTKEQRRRACYLLVIFAESRDATAVWYLTEAIREAVDAPASKERDERVREALESAGY